MNDLRETVRTKYAEAAAAVSSGTAAGCGPEGCGCVSEPGDPTHGFGPGSYSVGELGGLPDAAARASMGCGNRRPLRIFAKAKRSWTSDRAEGSTSCCPPIGSARRAARSAWT